MRELIDAKHNMLSLQPYFFSFLAQCSTYYTKNENVKTAAIGVRRNGEIHLQVNEEFFKSLSEKQRIGVLIHEVLHLVHSHFTRLKSELTGLNGRLWNVAMDVAINQHIPRDLLPESTCFLDNVLKDTVLPANQSTEFYYSKLYEKAEKVLISDSFDQHGECKVECDEKLADTIIKHAMKKAYDKNQGNISESLKQFLEDIFNQDTLNWKQILRNFIGNNISKLEEFSRTRPNRRIGLLAQGKKKTYKPKILVALDQSGSVDNESLGLMFNELRKLLKDLESSVDVIAFDTETQYLGNIEVYKDIKKERTFSGGTSFVPVYEDVKKYRSDLLIMFTDGYGDFPLEKSKVPTMFVLNHESEIDLPGIILRMSNILKKEELK